MSRFKAFNCAVAKVAVCKFPSENATEVVLFSDLSRYASVGKGLIFRLISCHREAIEMAIMCSIRTSP